MNKMKEKIMNASFKTRLLATSAVASVMTLGPSAFADESVSEGARAIRAASTDGITTALNELKTSVTEVSGSAIPVILSIGALIAVGFATVKVAKTFLGRAV